jgi:hypothetical protein
MYTFSSKLKTLSFILMILGALGIGFGFFNAPKNAKDVETILAASHGEHGESSASSHDAKPAHAEATHDTKPAVEAKSSHDEAAHSVANSKDTATAAAHNLEDISNHVEENHVADVAKPEAHAVEANHSNSKHEAKGHDAHAEHAEHVEHGLLYMLLPYSSC